MDRDGRWDRVERGYDAIVHGEAAHSAPDAIAAIDAAYARGETDEFVAGAGRDAGRWGLEQMTNSFVRSTQRIHRLMDGAS